MRLKIQLPAIAGQLRVADCEAEGIVTLPEQSFESFLRSPWQSPRWTAEHALLDEDGRRIYSGILILREGGLDGVFAYNRGSRFAYLPGAQAVVNSILHQAAEEIIQEGVENTNEGSWCYYFTELFEDAAYSRAGQWDGSTASGPAGTAPGERQCGYDG